MKRAALAGVGVLLLVVGTCCVRAVQTAPPALKTVEVPAPAGWPEGPTAGIFGINEAVSVPKRTLELQDPTNDRLRKLYTGDAETSRKVGARWVRSHTAVPPFLHWRRWSRDPAGAIADMDLWVQVVQEQELEFIVMLSPFPGNHTSGTTPTYVIDDPESYAEYVTAVVERYDGDGVDDMPGLARPVHVWEVDNEPDLKNTAQPRGKGAPRGFDPETFCTPEQYAAVLLETSRLIRAADSEAIVLNGGFYRPMTNTARKYMDALFAVEGVLESFDVLSLHAYHSGLDMSRFEEAIANGRALAPGKPIWITETNVPAVPGNKSEPWVNEEYQGEMVVRTFATALRLGVEHVFWHTLNDPPIQHKKDGPGMSTNSLFRAVEGSDRLEPKPAAAAYGAMARALTGVDWSEVAEVAAEGGEVVRIGEQWIVISYDGGPVTVELPPVSVSVLISGISVGVEEDGGSLTLDMSQGPLLLSAL